jgi:hypothetical protein
LEHISTVCPVLSTAFCAQFLLALFVQPDMESLQGAPVISVQIYFNIAQLVPFTLPVHHVKIAQPFFSSQVHSAKLVNNFNPTALLVKKHLTVLICFAIDASIHLSLTPQEFNAFLALMQFKIA